MHRLQYVHHSGLQQADWPTPGRAPMRVRTTTPRMQRRPLGGCWSQTVVKLALNHDAEMGPVIPAPWTASPSPPS